MSKFYVGQRVRIKNCQYPAKFGYTVGKEGTVVGHTQRRGIPSNEVLIDGEPEFRADGFRHAFRDDNLEPLQPERNQSIAWSECLWKPEHMRAEA